MRAAHLSIGFFALGTFACASLLGDFDVSATAGDAGQEGGNVDEGGPGDSGPGAVTITPSETKLGILHAVTFKADDATFAVKEAGGGTVDANGKYVAPATPGDYHVVATSKTDPSLTATATVHVSALAVSAYIGSVGGDGDLDGPVAAAQLRRPQGVAVSATATFIADTKNNVIRKLEGGNVSVFAGKVGVAGVADGALTDARFGAPTALAYDATGDKLYVSDAGNHCVRAIDLAASTVSTVGGTCDPANVGTYDGIGELAVMSTANDLLVCTSSNVRKLHTAGTKTDQAFQPVVGGSCAVADDGTKVYFTSNNKLNVVTEGLAVVGNANLPEAIASLAVSGTSLYAVSATSPVLYKWATTDTNLSGTPFLGQSATRQVVDSSAGDPRFADPNAITVSGTDLLVVERDADVIRKISGTTVSTVAGVLRDSRLVDGNTSAARFGQPAGIATDDSGFTYVADLGSATTHSNVIRKFDATTSTLISISGSASFGQQALDDANDKSAVIFAAPIDLVTVGANVFVLDAGGHAIRSVLGNGGVQTVAGSLNTAGFQQGAGTAAQFAFYEFSDHNVPAGAIATDGTTLFVADPGNHAVRTIAIAGSQVDTLAKDPDFNDPSGVAIDDGVLYVSDAADHVIRTIDTKTKAVKVFAGTKGTAGDTDGDLASATFSAPGRLAADHLGNLFVTERGADGFGSGVIRRIDIAGKKVSTFAGTLGKRALAIGALPSTVSCPTAIALLPQSKGGDLVFADTCNVTVALVAAPK